MTSIYGKFIRGIAWNSLESLAYHAVFLTHQVMLFKTIDTRLYGTASALISGIYFTVMLANAGLDASMGPFFGAMKSSKENFFRYAVGQLIVQLILLPACALAGLLLTASWMPTLCNESLLWPIVIGIVTCEGIKKSLRTLLQLAFLNHATTKAEIVYIIGYSLLVWTWIGARGTCTLIMLLAPLLIGSIINCLFLAHVAYTWYLELPDSQTIGTPHASWRRILKTRALGFMSITAQQLFSSNFLTPALALHSGAHAAGAFSLVATLMSSLTNIFHKVGGYTTQALLAHFKHEDLATKQSAFSFITTQLFHLLCVVTCFLLINYHTLLSYKIRASVDTSIMLFAYSYMGLMLCEYATLAYEKFLINEERAEYLGLYHGFAISCCIAAVLSAYGNPYILCGTLLLIRVASLVGLAYGTYRLWGISPQVTVNLRYIAFAVFASYMIRCILQYTI